jgi:GTP cyclohydrolase IA
VSGERQYLDGRPATDGLAGDDELGLDEWAAVAPRLISADQWRRFEGHMREIFAAMGMPVESPGTADTPRRFLRALFDATSGYEGDEKLVKAFPTECRGGPDCRISQVVEGPVPFFPCASTIACRSLARPTSDTSRTSTFWACRS